MSMEGVLDGVRRIVHKWVNTTTSFTQSVSTGDSVLNVRYTTRFSPGDEIMIKNDLYYETGLYVSSVDNTNKTITLSSPVLNNWNMSDSLLIKTLYGQFVQGIYIGDRAVINRYPAITINGVSKESQWFTLESSKERYEIELTVYVQASTQESGYRFLMNLTDSIANGLKRNIQPLVGEFDITSLTENVASGDKILNVSDVNVFNGYRRFVIEDESNTQENWVTIIYPSTENPSSGQEEVPGIVKIKDSICADYDKIDTSIIIPKRFIYNSWPKNIQYGVIHKGELLKAAKINWFAEEEELQLMRKQEPYLR